MKRKRKTKSSGDKKSKISLGEDHSYDPEKQVKFISWNVNGIRAWSKKEDGKYMKDIVEKEQPTAILMQETKLSSVKQEEKFEDLFDGYTAYFNTSVAKKGSHGTAVFCRDDSPMKVVEVTFGIKDCDDHNKEGRTIVIEYDNFYVINNYVPNSGSNLERLDYRIDEWDKDLQNYLLELEKKKPIIWAGDLNCAVLDIDVHNPKTQKSAGFTPRERKSFSTFLKNSNLIDSYRLFHPKKKQFTYWGYRYNLRSKNKGWRLDYFITSESLKDNIKQSYVLDEYYGSDHCPIGIILTKE